MRLQSPKLSDSSAPPGHRRKHRRRVPPSPSTTQEEELRLSAEPEDEYSQPDDLEQPEDPTSEEEGYGETTNADDETEIASYSDAHSVYPSHASGFSSPSPSTYINVAPLPIFRGAPGECPVAHLTRFERVCRANNAAALDTVARVFPVTLDGQAALWYELTVEPETALSWEEIKSAFLEAYRPPDFADRARSELMNIRQHKDESVNAYHLRLQWNLKLWPEHGIPDSLLKSIFVDGLREEYQDWIIPQRPESLAEAVGLATNWERAESAREARRRNEGGGNGGINREDVAIKCGFCDGPHEESGCGVRRRMRELWLRSREAGGGGAESGRRLLSPARSLVRREGGGGGDGGEEEDGEAGRAVSLKRSQCQCWKHQCRTRLERSNSAMAAMTDVSQPGE